MSHDACIPAPPSMLVPVEHGNAAALGTCSALVEAALRDGRPGNPRFTRRSSSPRFPLPDMHKYTRKLEKYVVKLQRQVEQLEVGKGEAALTTPCSNKLVPRLYGGHAACHACMFHTTP